MHLHLGVFQSIAKSCQSLQQLFLDGSTSVCDKSLLLVSSSLLVKMSETLYHLMLEKPYQCDIEDAPPH